LNITAFILSLENYFIISLIEKSMLPQTIERILSLGGGVSIDASKYLPQSLERFAVFAAQSGATLIIRNCQRLLPQSMEKIAAYGKGKVIFNLDE
jgi:hypothetical protein